MDAIGLTAFTVHSGMEKRKKPEKETHSARSSLVASRCFAGYEKEKRSATGFATERAIILSSIPQRASSSSALLRHAP